MDTDFELPLDLELDEDKPAPALPDRRELPLVSNLSSAGEPPHLGVYVLKEFVYCPRAGLCAYESGKEEEEQLPPAWGHWPMGYSLQEIEEALALAFRDWWVLLVLTVVAGVTAAVLRHMAIPFWPFGAWAACLWFALGSAQRGVLYVALQLRRRRARAATPVEPNPASAAPQVVQWWELLQAGFEVLPVPASYHDPDWNLSGRPWRLLRKGSLHIPVWRRRSGKRDIRLTHRVRMAAYCHLVEGGVGATGCAPYGVILFGDSDEGTTVPFNTANRQALAAELHRAHEVLRASQRGVDPPEPNSARPCSTCHHGCPKLYKHGRSDHQCQGHKLPVVRVVDKHERVFHSHCGDRFGWRPRHEVVEELGLRSET